MPSDDAIVQHIGGEPYTVHQKNIFLIINYCFNCLF